MPVCGSPPPVIMDLGFPATQIHASAGAGALALTGSRDGATPGRAADACANASDAREPPAKRVKLIAAAPAGHEGDRRQANAVAAETKRALSQAGFYQEDEISSDPLTINGHDYPGRAKLLRMTCDAWMENLYGIQFKRKHKREHKPEYERAILILAGSDQRLAPVLGEIPPNDEMITAFTGHKLTPDIKKAKYLPGFMALPASSVSDEERAALQNRTTLILTAGVAHDLTPESIAAQAREYRAKGYKPIPPIGPDTVAILLGGDVIGTESGSVKRLTPGDARRLAYHIARTELTGRKNCHFVIVSSPRTGKYGADGLEVTPNPHRSGIRDEVTKAFEETLRKYSKARIDVFDFQYGETPSAYAPLLHAYATAAGPTGHIHVPGDSVSMISEVASVLPGVMVIDATASMDESHRHAAEAIAMESGIAVLGRDGRMVPGKGAQATAPESAARRIADAIVELIRGAMPGSATRH